MYWFSICCLAERVSCIELVRPLEQPLTKSRECRCGNDPKSIQQVDEAMCDHCCMNDPKLGECGNSCPPEHPNIANVYQRQAVLQQYTPAPPPPPVEPSCPPKSTEQPVPEPVSVSEVVSELPAASTPCPLSTPPPYQAPQGSAPAPQTYATAVSSSAQPTTLVAAASTSPCASPEPEISPAYQSSAWAASTQAYGTPYVPSQVPAGSGSVSLVALTATFFAMIILSVMFN